MTLKFYKLALTTLLVVGSIATASAQERTFIREQISNAGVCRNVVITQSNGDLALIGNGYVARGIPRSLTRTLDEIKATGEEITDVQLTESGRWIVLYGTNGVTYNDLPETLVKALRDYNSAGSRITSVTFTDGGKWIVATPDAFTASDAQLSAWLKEGADQLGILWSACLTDKGCVALYSGGTRILGDIPASLREALDRATIDIYRLKIAGTAWFFADKKGAFNYSM